MAAKRLPDTLPALPAPLPRLQLPPNPRRPPFSAILTIPTFVTQLGTSFTQFAASGAAQLVTFRQAQPPAATLHRSYRWRRRCCWQAWAASPAALLRTPQPTPQQCCNNMPAAMPAQAMVAARSRASCSSGASTHQWPTRTTSCPCSPTAGSSRSRRTSQPSSRFQLCSTPHALPLLTSAPVCRRATCLPSGPAPAPHVPRA